MGPDQPRDLPGRSLPGELRHRPGLRRARLALVRWFARIGAPLKPRPTTADAARRTQARSSPLFNQSLEKGLAVLLAFSPHSESMNLADIAGKCGMSKSAAQRFAYTLEVLGYLRKDPVTRRYSLTVATLGLGYRYLLVDRIVERANPFLLDLNRACGETVNFSEPSGTDMVYVGRFPTSRTTPVHMPLGRCLPMYCTSSGRAYLSLLQPSERLALLEASDRIAYTPSTITEIPKLLALCAEAAKRGYAYSSSEYYPGDLNVAAAVVDVAGRPLGAVNISAPSTRWTLARVKSELAPLAIETARLMSTRQPDLAQLAPFSLGSGKAAPTRNMAGRMAKRARGPGRARKA
ncbi:MAG: IclR family transcriptional regulator [Betaproteobacteria bacterium]|nr:IclR family transcriptional regulator [Betaproteobacteria bacterium]